MAANKGLQQKPGYLIIDTSSVNSNMILVGIHGLAIAYIRRKEL